MLLDTHIWLWYILGSDSLSHKLKDQIEYEPEKVLLSTISIWETSILIEKKKIRVKSGAESFVRNALKEFPIKEVPINSEIAIQSRTLKFTRQDPADRIIAATSKIYDVRLATVDKNLTKLSWLRCIS